MNPKWRLLVLGICIARSESRKDYYHELSMETFTTSPGISKPDSLFGYSVTYVPENKRLIVSAPTMSYVGELFACDIHHRKCEQIVHNITDVHEGHYYWLGATVEAGHDFFTTCAPRYLTSLYKMLGTYSRCYKFSIAGEHFESKLLAQTTKKEITQPTERLMDSFGWSIAVADYNVTIGGPAVYKGRVIQYTDITSYSLKPKLIDTLNLNIDYNFGYSVVAGQFLKKDKTSFAFSTTYGDIGYGKIIIYDGNKKTPIIEDTKDVRQVGSLFGASLCSAILNSRSALLVGAPAYGNDHQYNVGAVHVYEFSREVMNLVYVKSVYGQKDGSYFGYAMINLGDLNGDKKDEVAISAPYEDDGRGAVYIYSGMHLYSKPEKELTWLQRIQPQHYQGFGMSLSVLKDYDENGCNELAIGVPTNETVVLLRCMATIGIHIITLKSHKEIMKSTPATGPSFKFESCVGIYYPSILKTINANISVTLTITHKNCKLENGAADGTVVTYGIPERILQEKKQTYCHTVTIITPLEANYDPYVPYAISATLHNDPRDLKDFDRNRVVINERGNTYITDGVYVSECTGNECVPKLELIVLPIFPKHYVIGSTNTQILRIYIENKADVAYGVCVAIHLKGISVKEWPRSCVWKSENNVLICTPLILIRNATEWKNEDILLDTQSLNSDDKTVNIKVDLYTKCGDFLTKSYNESVALYTDKHVIVTGSTMGGDVVKVTNDNIDYTGKQIHHAYSIYNNGTTTWVNFEMTIELEKQSYVGKHTVNTKDAFVCTYANETPKKYISKCRVKMLKANRKVEVTLSIDLPPITLGDFLDNPEGAAIVSKIAISFHGEQRSHSIKSRLLLYNIEVPLWIIISSCIVGILLLIILALILHECGCLRRKNKEKLKELKREVRRQSMRRSMMVRDSPRTSQPSDVQPLIKASDSEDLNEPYYNVPKLEKAIEPIPSTHVITPKVDPIVEPVEDVIPDIPQAACILTPSTQAPIPSVTPKTAPTPPSKPNKKLNDGAPTDTTSQNKIRADLILGGLQKNLAKQHSSSSSTSNPQ